MFKLFLDPHHRILDLPTDNHPNPGADPEWCDKVMPDCTVSYTKQHCNQFCKSNNGNYAYIILPLDER